MIGTPSILECHRKSNGNTHLTVTVLCPGRANLTHVFADRCTSRCCTPEREGCHACLNHLPAYRNITRLAPKRRIRRPAFISHSYELLTTDRELLANQQKSKCVLSASVRISALTKTTGASFPNRPSTIVLERYLGDHGPPNSSLHARQTFMATMHPICT